MDKLGVRTIAALSDRTYEITGDRIAKTTLGDWAEHGSARRVNPARLRVLARSTVTPDTTVDELYARYAAAAALPPAELGGQLDIRQADQEVIAANPHAKRMTENWIRDLASLLRRQARGGDERGSSVNGETPHTQN